jgi:serine/threonine-protein kinase
VCRREDGTDLVKVLDFGVAKLEFLEKSGAATRTGTVLGTPSYMSPEQARGEKNVDHLSDVYALGAILYELLSGKKPHPGESHNAILHHIATQPPLPLALGAPELPEALVAVVQRTLAGNVQERPASAEEFAVALAPWARADVWPPPKLEPSAPRHAEPSTTLPAPVSGPNSAGFAAGLAVHAPERESVAPASGTPESIEVSSRDRKSAQPERPPRLHPGLVLAGGAVLAAAMYVLVPLWSKRPAEPDRGMTPVSDKTATEAPTLDAVAAMDPHAALAAAPPRSATELTTATDTAARSAETRVIHAPTAAVNPHGSGTAVARAPAAGAASGRPLGRPAATTAGESAHPREPADGTSALAPVRFDQTNPYTDQKP